jgi:hypothetical protein
MSFDMASMRKRSTSEACAAACECTEDDDAEEWLGDNVGGRESEDSVLTLFDA